MHYAATISNIPPITVNNKIEPSPYFQITGEVLNYKQPFFSLFPSFLFFLLFSQKKELDLAAPSTKNPTRRRGRDEEDEEEDDDDDDGKGKEKQDQKRRRTRPKQRPKKRCFSRQSHRAGGNFLEIRVFLRCFRKVVRGVVENECLERL